MWRFLRCMSSSLRFNESHQRPMKIETEGEPPQGAAQLRRSQRKCQQRGPDGHRGADRGRAVSQPCDPQVMASLRLAKRAGPGAEGVSNVRLVLMIAVPDLAGRPGFRACLAKKNKTRQLARFAKCWQQCCDGVAGCSPDPLTCWNGSFYW